MGWAIVCMIDYIMEKKKMSKYVYMVMDGRANFDTDKATVLEVVGESDDERDAICLAYFDKEYKKQGMDSCLVRYSDKGEICDEPVLIDSTMWEG